MKKAPTGKKASGSPGREEVNHPLLSALREAILREREARDFYRERSELTQHDPEVHDIYLQLYEEEVDHEAQLLAKFKGLCKRWNLDWKTELREDEEF
ncbi:MAG: hypothetical protein ACR2L2_12625 [Acidobacteriota bacterium]